MIAFGQELAGTLRRASVMDALLRHIRENLAPTEIALALFHHDVDAQDFPARLAAPAGPTGGRCWSSSPAGGLWSCPTDWIPCSPTGLCRRSRNRRGSWLFAPLRRQE